MYWSNFFEHCSLIMPITPSKRDTKHNNDQNITNFILLFSLFLLFPSFFLLLLLLVIICKNYNYEKLLYYYNVKWQHRITIHKIVRMYVKAHFHNVKVYNNQITLHIIQHLYTLPQHTINTYYYTAPRK